MVVTRSKRLAEAAGFALLALTATWPLAGHFTTQAPGSNVWNGRVIHFETPVNLWNLWWFRHALLELGQNPFDCAYLFYPYGASLWFHTLSPLPAFIGAWLQPTLGLVPTHNALVLASFVAAGLSAAAVARHVGLDRTAAMLGGAIYAFSPAVFAHLYVGHFELLWTFWMPAILLAFLRIVDSPGAHIWSRGVLLGLMFAAAAYTSAYYAIYSLELVAVAAVVRWRVTLRAGTLQSLAVASLVAATATAPLVTRFTQTWPGLSDTENIRRNFREFSIEPIGLFVPSFMHPLLAAPLRSIHVEMTRGRALPQETTGYLGLTAIGLAIAGIVRQRRASGAGEDAPAFDRHLMIAIAASFLVLSLGAEIKWLGRPTGFPLPAAALAEVPILRMARAPGRHVIVAMLGIAVLAAAGWQRIAAHRWRLALIVALAFEYWAPVPLVATEVHEVYHRIAREPDTFAIVDVPVGLRDGTRIRGRPDAARLLAQTVHHKPMVDGMVSRLPDERWAAVSSAPLIGSLLDPGRGARPSPEEAGAYFTRWNIKALVVHPNASEVERRLIETSLLIGRRESFSDGTELWWVR